MLKLAARKHGLPSAGGQTLGKPPIFAECLAVTTLGKVSFTVTLPLHLLYFAEGRVDTRQSVCQVPGEKHSANRPLPSKQ